MIRYILGKGNSGKSHKLHQLFNEEKEYLVIVPEQYTLAKEEEIIRDLNVSGLLHIDVISFNRFSNRVIDETGRLKETEINSLGRSMILRSIIDKHSDEFLVYSSIAKKEGFIAKITELFSIFKHSGIELSHLKTYVEKEEKRLIREKLHDIYIIFKHYEEFLEKGYYDEEDKLREVIKRLEYSSILSNKIVCFDGFSSFSNNEYMLIEEIIKKTDCIFSFTVGKEMVFSPSNKTFKKIRELAKEHNIKEEKLVVNYNKDSSDLYALKNNFFYYPMEYYRGDLENISLTLCKNYYDEINEIAIGIVKKIREGYRYKDISMVSGDITRYSSVIERIFSAYDIPYFLDEKRSVLNNSFIKFIFSSLYAVNSGFKKEDIIRVLKSGYIRVEDEYELENYILSKGFRGENYITKCDEEYLEDMKCLMNPLLKLSSDLKKAKTIKSKTEALYTYLIDNKIDDFLNDYIDYLKKEDEQDKMQEVSQIWEALISVFDQLIELEGEDEKSLKEYIYILKSGLEDVRLGIVPPKNDQVIIANIERSRVGNKKILYIFGLNDDNIPKKYVDQGLLLESEKKELKTAGFEIENDLSSVIERDYFSTYAAISKADEKVYLSYSLSDLEGVSIRPSIYIDRLKKVLGLKVKSTILKDKNPGDYYNYDTHFLLLTEYLRKHFDGYEIDEDWFSVLSWYDEIDKNKVDLLKRSLLYNNQVDRVEEKYIKDLYHLPIKTSVSRLENYKKCPFSHFIKYGLRPKDRKEYAIDLPDIGIILHKTLEEFDKVIRSGYDYKKVTESEIIDIIDKIVEDITSNYNSDIFTFSKRNNYMVRRIKKIARRAAITSTYQLSKGEFTPFRHELQFKEKSRLLPLYIKLSDDSIMTLEGIIDRLDILEEENTNYLKIIDYKSGSKKFSLNELYHGLQLQLFVYLKAVLENKAYFKEKNLYPAGVFYFKIDDPMIETEKTEVEEDILKSLKLDGLIISEAMVQKMDVDIDEKLKSLVVPAELKKDGSLSKRSSVIDYESSNLLFRHMDDVLKSLGDGIISGNIDIKPIMNNNVSGCMFCDYKSICKFDTKFNNDFNFIKKYSNDEIMEKINEVDR